MLKVTIEDYCLLILDTSSTVVLSPLCFDYRNWFDYMSITHDKNHIIWAEMLKIRGLNYPTHHITIILRLET